MDARVSAAARSPTAYLLAAENRDGGFGAAPGQRSSTLYSGWAALGLAAAGHNPAAVSRRGPSLLSYIERHVGTDAGSLERTILVARAAGVPATKFGGHDLVSALQPRHQRGRVRSAQGRPDHVRGACASRRRRRTTVPDDFAG